jgi:hypothetical protein
MALNVLSQSGRKKSSSQFPRFERVLGTLIAGMSLRMSLPEDLLVAVTSAVKRTLFEDRLSRNPTCRKRPHTQPG